MRFDFLKNLLEPVTTLLGLAALTYGLYEFATATEPGKGAYLLTGTGTILLFAKDKIPTFMQEFVDAIVGRIKGNP